MMGLYILYQLTPASKKNGSHLCPSWLGLMAPIIPAEFHNRLGFCTWRMGSHLVSVVNTHGDRRSPKDRVSPLPNGRFMAYKSGL